MCYFITAALPRALVPVLQKCKQLYAGEVFPHPDIAAHLPKDCVQCLIPCKGCGCDLYTPAPDEEEPSPERLLAQKVDKMRQMYQKKHWTPEKIERAVQNYLKSRETLPPPPASAPGFDPLVKQAVAQFVTECGSIFIHVHFYKGGYLYEEKLQITPQHVRLSEFESETFIAKEDVLYRVSLK